MPVVVNVKRALVTPKVALDEWIPTNFNSSGNLSIPKKDVYSSTDFYRWTYDKSGNPTKSTIPLPTIWAYETYYLV